MSWKPEVIADRSGQWAGNALRFATREEAETNVANLAMRWLAVRETRVVEFPVEKVRGGALVEVTAARGYRPADVDPTTQDRRNLGVWIQNVAGR